ncbi:hypothetical protein IHN63_21180, partial [Deinococcus sp. 6YEL10]|uniref:condensation domain-containing protein n=1 Tax=Deinococcus sp. 6YEL10 TaxID=2745870 RepID=UPI001E286FC8
TLDLRGLLDPARLRVALTDTLRAVPALHVRFRDDGHRVRQLLGPVTPRAPQEHDLSGHPDPDARAQAITGALLDAPLDLPGGELYRHALLRLGPDHLRWVFVTHHIALSGLLTAPPARSALLCMVSAYRAPGVLMRRGPPLTPGALRDVLCAARPFPHAVAPYVHRAGT